MRILLVSKFLHHVGGVETYVRWLSEALVDAGHHVGLVGMTPPQGAQLMVPMSLPTWQTPNRSYSAGAAHRARSAAASVWSPETAGLMKQAADEFAPDVVHFHGTCFQLTPSVVDVAARRGLRSVLTAHEYKLVCANQTLFDDGLRSICTDCVGRSGPGKVKSILTRNCMKGSRAVSLLGAVEGRVADRVWERARPRVLAPSRFMRDLLVRDGWSADDVEYLDLPWRNDDESVTPSSGHTRPHLVFLGRLAPNKGVDMLLDAWTEVAADLPDSRLRILGDGSEDVPLRNKVDDERIPRVDFLGYADRDTIATELGQAFATAHPSRWHENSPFSVRESLMAGVPALVSRVGGMQEMVSEATGATVPHDDPGAWAEAIRRAALDARAGTDSLRLAVEARAVTRGQHLARLVDVYDGK